MSKLKDPAKRAYLTEHRVSRRRTIHVPEHKDTPRREHCPHATPRCHEGHYVSVPALSTRGTFPISHMVGDAEMAGLAIMYKQLGGNRW